MIVDSWLIPSTSEVVDRWMSDPRYVHGFKNIFGKDAVKARTLSQLLAELDEAGIDVAVLTAMGDRNGEVAPNRLVADICAEYPDRFVGSFCFDPWRINESLAHFEEVRSQSQYSSAVVLPWAYDLPPDHARWFPLYSYAEAEELVVTIQVGHTAPLFRSRLGWPMFVDDVALAFPSLRIVLGHLGWPWTQEVIALASKHTSVFIDTSAHSPSRLPAEIVAFMDSHQGREKVMFGSDYPALELQRAIVSARRLKLSDEAVANYLGRTATSVFRIEDKR